MTIFYRGPRARITHEVFEVRSPSSVSFPVSELSSIYIVRQRPAQLTAGVVLAKAGTTVLAGAGIAVAAIAWRALDSYEVVVAVLLASTVTSVVSAGGCWRTRENPYELRATFRGVSVCLLRTADERELCQVRRALLRALEWRTERE
ncbi:MAG TPA: hypothetical protein DGG94_08665 [Micromonosporaceae bacterium]|nr:hypothetical protein [Micromonosporaceae bacterium]HCU49856.1 hypothetical protein [Micromonosporaceae bacterium]